mgnify:CR=1 FL=1
MPEDKLQGDSTGVHYDGTSVHYKVWISVERIDEDNDKVIERFPYHLQPMPTTPKRLLVTGTTAVALGKLKAGQRVEVLRRYTDIALCKPLHVHQFAELISAALQPGMTPAPRRVT